MAKWQEKADEYHEQFAARIIKALEEGTAPWQKPWKPGERILAHNFGSGRDYRGGNALYLALTGLERGDADLRWGGYRQIQEDGGHVRKGQKGTPILYVDFNRRQTARDEQGKPVRDEEGRPQVEWVKRDRPLVKLHHVFNVEETEGLQLRSLATAGPEWEGHERAEALIKASGVRVDHVAGDRAYYSLKADRVVLPERSQFPSQDAYTHTALHELGHATGHPDRLNRPTLVEHGGFGTEAYAREELRAEIAAMMTGEQLGVGHEPRHGTAYVSSWIKALENDPREIRAAADDAQRISDWLISRERERSLGDEQAEHERPSAGAGRTPEREPEREPEVPGATPEAGHRRGHLAAGLGGVRVREDNLMSHGTRKARVAVGTRGNCACRIKRRRRRILRPRRPTPGRSDRSQSAAGRSRSERLRRPCFRVSLCASTSGSRHRWPPLALDSLSGRDSLQLSQVQVLIVVSSLP